MGTEAKVRSLPERTEIDRIPRIPLQKNELIRGNFAFKALDPKRLEDMQGDKFDRVRYANNAPEVVRVFDPDSPTGWRYKPVDGHHRIACHPDEMIEVSDITERLIETTYPGQEFLTSLQFLDEVRGPTEAQKNIAPQRMALHIISEWRGIVGEAAGESSGLAAVVLLGIDGLRDEPEDTVKRYFARNSSSLLGEEDESRAIIIDGLLGLRQTVSETNKAYDTLALSVFQEITELSDTEEDTLVKQTQIRGLFTLAEVRRKVTEDASDRDELLERQNTLYDLISDVLPQTSEDPRENAAFREALLNSLISYNNLVTILTSPQASCQPEANQSDMRLLSNRYDEVKRIINIKSLKDLYKAQPESDHSADPAIVTEIMGKIAGREILGPKDSGKIVDLAQIAGEEISKIDSSLAQLELSSRDFFREDEWAERVVLLTRAREAILQAQTVSGLKKCITSAETLLKKNETKMPKKSVGAERPLAGFPAASEPVVLIDNTCNGSEQQAKLLAQLRADNERLEAEKDEKIGVLEGIVRDRDRVIEEQAKEIERLRSSAAWWMVVPDLTPTQKRVAQAHAEGRRTELLIGGMTGDQYNRELQRAFGRLQSFRRRMASS